MNAAAFLKTALNSGSVFLALSSMALADPALDRALEPLEHGVPEVAVVKLRERLGAAPEVEKQAQIRTKLAEALLAAGRPEEALAEIEELKKAGSDAPLLAARANAILGHWEKALALYGGYLDVNPEGADATLAALGKAESLRALARLPEAVELLQGVVRPTETISLRLAELYLESGELEQCAALVPRIEPGTPAAEKWKQYIEARLLLAQGHPAYALGRFEDLHRDFSAPGLTTELITGSLLGVSDSRAKLSGLAAADNVLEQFIWRHPESPRLGEIFAKLDEIYAGEENPSESELQKWAEREPASRAGYATYYLARAYTRAGKRERALRALEEYDERFSRHPMLSATLLARGRLLTEEKKFRQAQESLDAAMRASQTDLERAEIEMASATISFKEGEFVLAATVFRAAGERAPALWERAVFNSALSWLHQGNFARFLQDYQELSERKPDSPYRRELILEEGLLQARQGGEHAEKAEATLQQFIRDFGDNPRVAEAKIALAELRLAQNDAAGASQVLQAVNEVEEGGEPLASPEALEQSTYLAIFVADAAEPRDDAKVAALCTAFLERYPRAAKRPEVRMKYGQVCFRTGDFVGAQAQFETLARETPASPLVETALFLAGQASMKRMTEGSVDRALELFEEVARMDGPLKLQARLQQALAQNRLGKQGEAILLYDVILRGEPPPEVRFAALAGKAANLAELGEKDPAAREQALELYTKLAAEPDLGVTWRAQALYQKGRLLEALKRAEEALAAYYDVLEAGLAKPEEYYWFYRAGFEAGRLCEARGQWKSAIAIYRKMAALEGPQAEEAGKLANELRLKHFIWE